MTDLYVEQWAMSSSPCHILLLTKFMAIGDALLLDLSGWWAHIIRPTYFPEVVRNTIRADRFTVPYLSTVANSLQVKSHMSVVRRPQEDDRIPALRPPQIAPSVGQGSRRGQKFAETVPDLPELIDILCCCGLRMCQMADVAAIVIFTEFWHTSHTYNGVFGCTRRYDACNRFTVTSTLLPMLDLFSVCPYCNLYFSRSASCLDLFVLETRPSVMYLYLRGTYLHIHCIRLGGHS